MKILLLNPHIDAAHDILKKLRERGVALLMPENAEEAWQMLKLHSSSVDLAVIHREGGKGQNPEEGIQFVTQLKGDPSQADLPFIITSSVWDDAKFAEHQQTSAGANAYLRWPFTDVQLFNTIEAMFGPERSRLIEPPTAGSFQGLTSVTGMMNTGTAPVILEQVSDVFTKASDSQIQLQSPEIDNREGLQESPKENKTVELQLSEEAPMLAEPQVAEPQSVESQPPIEFNGLEVPPPSALTQPSSSVGSEATGLSISLDTRGDEQGSVAKESLAEGSSSRSLEFLESEEEREVATEMPYLFEKPSALPEMLLAQPLGDAVVPGGAAQSPDIETLKKYLLLREQDVAALSAKMRAFHEQLNTVENSLRIERARNVELTHTAVEQKRKIDDFEKEKALEMESLQSQLSELQFQLKTKTDKVKVLNANVREATEEMERLKERVRSDIRKIRTREKELENRLEIARKDTEVLIGARESKIIELKRKLDLLEFNMDLLQDQYAREKDNSAKLRDRLAKAAQVVRVAGGFLDSPSGGAKGVGSPDSSEPSGEGSKQEAS